MLRSVRVASAACALVVGLATSGCAGEDRQVPPQPEDQATPSTSPLAGTEWRLVELQSMDDTQGTLRPEDPSRFTLGLNEDGTASLVLDCNRATGTWSAEAGADPSSGRFTFGPLAATRALCPPPHLDERIAAQAESVASYLLRDGRLHLSLMADGGGWVWEPVPPGGFSTDPDPALESAILDASPDYTREMVDVEGGVGPARYVHARVDLNGDGRDEVFAYLLGSIFCGTGGCNLLLFTEAAQGYALLNEFPLARLPIVVAEEATSGWHDLLKLESGGGAEATYLRYTWNGERYVSGARTPADPEPQGRRYLSGELTFEQGIPLEPKR